MQMPSGPSGHDEQLPLPATPTSNRSASTAGTSRFQVSPDHDKYASSNHHYKGDPEVNEDSVDALEASTDVVDLSNEPDELVHGSEHSPDLHDRVENFRKSRSNASTASSATSSPVAEQHHAVRTGRRSAVSPTAFYHNYESAKEGGVPIEIPRNAPIRNVAMYSPRNTLFKAKKSPAQNPSLNGVATRQICPQNALPLLEKMINDERINPISKLGPSQRVKASLDGSNFFNQLSAVPHASTGPSMSSTPPSIDARAKRREDRGWEKLPQNDTPSVNKKWSSKTRIVDNTVHEISDADGDTLENEKAHPGPSDHSDIVAESPENTSVASPNLAYPTKGPSGRKSLRLKRGLTDDISDDDDFESGPASPALPSVMSTVTSQLKRRSNTVKTYARKPTAPKAFLPLRHVFEGENLLELNVMSIRIEKGVISLHYGTPKKAYQEWAGSDIKLIKYCEDRDAHKLLILLEGANSYLLVCTNNPNAKNFLNGPLAKLQKIYRMPGSQAQECIDKCRQLIGKKYTENDLNAAGNLASLTQVGRPISKYFHPTSSTSVSDAETDVASDRGPPRRRSERLGKKMLEPESDDELFTYPKNAKDGLVVRSGDVRRLNSGQFLNDTIIEFYYKYLLNTKIDEGLRERVYIFSSFFYQHLTRKTDDTRSAYDRVQGWTSKVDIFSKDFLFFPINERLHWYLVLVFNPGALLRAPIPATTESEDEIMVESESSSSNYSPPRTNQLNLSVDSVLSVNLFERPISHDAPNAPPPENGNANSTIPNGLESPVELLVDLDVTPENSDKDHVSDVVIMETLGPKMQIREYQQKHKRNEEAMQQQQVAKGKLLRLKKKAHQEEILRKKEEKALKRSLVEKTKCHMVLFDSLSLSHRETLPNLKNYLMQEAWGKKNVDATANRICGHVAKVPKQSNHCDCGIFILQYVETFLADPDKYMHMIFNSIQNHDNWFTQNKVAEKREEIKRHVREVQEFMAAVATPPSQTPPSMATGVDNSEDALELTEITFFSEVAS